MVSYLILLINLRTSLSPIQIKSDLRYNVDNSIVRRRLNPKPDSRHSVSIDPKSPDTFLHHLHCFIVYFHHHLQQSTTSMNFKELMQVQGLPRSGRGFLETWLPLRTPLPQVYFPRVPACSRLFSSKTIIKY